MRNLRTLTDRFHGEIVRPADPGYDAARVVWNGMVDRRPALIVRPTGATDVATAVGFAREQASEIGEPFELTTLERSRAQAIVLAQIDPRTNAFERLSKPESEATDLALGGDVVAEILVDQRAQEILLGREVLAIARRFERVEALTGNPLKLLEQPVKAFEALACRGDVLEREIDRAAVVRAEEEEADGFRRVMGKDGGLHRFRAGGAGELAGDLILFRRRGIAVTAVGAADLAGRSRSGAVAGNCPCARELPGRTL